MYNKESINNKEEDNIENGFAKMSEEMPSFEKHLEQMQNNNIASLEDFNYDDEDAERPRPTPDPEPEYIDTPTPPKPDDILDHEYDDMEKPDDILDREYDDMEKPDDILDRKYDDIKKSDPGVMSEYQLPLSPSRFKKGDYVLLPDTLSKGKSRYGQVINISSRGNGHGENLIEVIAEDGHTNDYAESLLKNYSPNKQKHVVLENLERKFLSQSESGARYQTGQTVYYFANGKKYTVLEASENRWNGGTIYKVKDKEGNIENIDQTMLRSTWP